MVSNVHYIEVLVKGESLELESQRSLNLRINNVLFNPTQTTTKQAEFSYSFDIPSTPKNDRILNYANNLAKTNKFHARYPAQVIADGEKIFDASMTVEKYDANEKMYTCNLVNIKILSLEEIFEDMVMTDLKWMVDFDGAPSINEVNADNDTKYYFPLVSYGVFIKRPVMVDEVGGTYTPKHNLDKYNKWWIDSFYPSLNMVETMKKAFENNGYSVGGNVFSDPFIQYIYASTNLADGQVPIYNLGNPRFGELKLNIRWDNTKYSDSTPFYQDLSFPYEKIGFLPHLRAGENITSAEGLNFNFNAINFWNMMDSTNNPSGVTVSMYQPSYMYDPWEHLIVIPADGWYKIHMEGSAFLHNVGQTFSATQYTARFGQQSLGSVEINTERVPIRKSFSGSTPLEIQLIRNYDENIELIKGKYNFTYCNGRPLDETVDYLGITYPNIHSWDTEFPHQALYSSEPPTLKNGLVVTTQKEQARTLASTKNDGGFGGLKRNTDNSSRVISHKTYGYFHMNGDVMPYDPAVSPAFICGMSSLGSGTLSVLKNGYSWSKMCSERYGMFANVNGLGLIERTSSGEVIRTATNHDKNEYRYASNYYSSNNSDMEFGIDCCVYLHKDDKLELMAIQRDYDGQAYDCSANINLYITAMSERDYEELKGDPNWTYHSTTEFPYELNLFNFTNKETKVSDWIKNVQTAFNLDINIDGTNVDINTNQGINKDIDYAVDVDDRVSSYEAISEYISYPKEMSVRYKINTDEWGFEQSVPREHINDDDWKKWGDSGFTIIQLSDDTYETKTQNTSTQFSYTWYDNFLYKEVYQDGTENENSGLTISIPVISKAEYMVEGYGYEEAMKHDGYSLTQRFWYRDQVSQEYVWTADVMHDKIFLTYPINAWNRFNLSYKDTEKSIVTEYFNICPMLSSNYVKIDVYINPQEYKSIKGGALVHFDSDLYYTSEISGYDPSGGNATTLKLIKKV